MRHEKAKGSATEMIAIRLPLAVISTLKCVRGRRKDHRDLSESLRVWWTMTYHDEQVQP